MPRPSHCTVGIVVLAVLASVGPTARACGPYAIGAAFWNDHEPGPALPAFLEGQLGMLVNLAVQRLNVVEGRLHLGANGALEIRHVGMRRHRGLPGT